MINKWRVLAAPHAATMAQFGRFGVVGVVGLVIDTATVYAVRGISGLYIAGLLSYVAAATGTWLLNRWWTFRGQGSGSALRQWVRFLGANSLGFVLNRGTYVILIATIPLAVAQPIIAIAAGSAAGMVVNFALSRRLVFR